MKIERSRNIYQGRHNSNIHSRVTQYLIKTSIEQQYKPCCDVLYKLELIKIFQSNTTRRIYQECNVSNKFTPEIRAWGVNQRTVTI